MLDTRRGTTFIWESAPRKFSSFFVIHKLGKSTTSGKDCGANYQENGERPCFPTSPSFANTVNRHRMTNIHSQISVISCEGVLGNIAVSGEESKEDFRPGRKKGGDYEVIVRIFTGFCSHYAMDS
jgi:hypothetical protein